MRYATALGTAFRVETLNPAGKSISDALLQENGPLFRHFKPRFPFGTDASLFKASKLNATFVFKKVAAPPTQLPKPVHKAEKASHGTCPCEQLSGSPNKSCMPVLQA